MKKVLFSGIALSFLFACTETTLDTPAEVNLKAASKQSVEFAALSSINVGGEAAAEISAFDPLSQRLFVVNNDGMSRVDVVDLADPASPVYLTSIGITPYGGGVNSVAVKNGMLAAAVEAFSKTDDGSVELFSTSDYTHIAGVGVGALPDMVCFSPDGKYILTANEGEPNTEYTVDPEGSVSIIEVKTLIETRLNFAAFAGMQAELMAKGLRVFGPNASFVQDMEPEYIAVAQNSKMAWVSLQENNALAKIDLEEKSIVQILPLGFKNYSLPGNQIDANDEDDKYLPGSWPVYGIYEPDAIAIYSHNNTPFVFTANEGDAREYIDEELDIEYFVEEKRISKVDLDPVAFPNAGELQEDEMIGRLNITTTLGDTDGDDDFDALYSFGARSFSIWNGHSGKQVFDSGNELDIQADANHNYDDGRSDNKSIEPEGLVTGRIGNTELLFVGMERVDAVVVYDISNPIKPKYLQWLVCGDAPEGLVFVSAEDSPSGKPLLIVSSEDDGVVTIYTTIDPS